MARSIYLTPFKELSVYKANCDLRLTILWFTKEFSKVYKYTVNEHLNVNSGRQMKTNETIVLNRLFANVN